MPNPLTAALESVHVVAARAAGRLAASDFPSRRQLAAGYLQGQGIEIGALHRPLLVPKSIRVTYVDRMDVADLRQQYHELKNEPLVNVDVIDDGERLRKFGDASQDFVIANHFIEHCQNPVLALCNMLRVLRPGGILYLAVPDKRYTFDVERPLTGLDHLWRDYDDGPTASRRQHFEEFTRFVHKIGDPVKAEEHTNFLMEMDYSIHYHVWTQVEVLQLLLSIRQRFNLTFDLEMMLKNGEEVIFVLRV